MDFINTGLMHPASVHFPIALIILALILKITLYITPKSLVQYKPNIRFTYLVMLYLAPVFMLVTTFLADLDLETVRNQLCNFPMVQAHEEQSDLTLIFLLLTVLTEVGTIVLIRYKIFLLHLATILLIICNYFLIETASLGGQLVYEQGTGVKNAKCE